MTRGAISNVQVTPVLGVGGAYASGDNVGAILTLTNALTPYSFSGRIISVTLTDLNKQNAELDLTFFNANPSTGTFTDNAAQVIPTAELSKIAGTVKIHAAHYTNYSATSAACVPEINLGIQTTGQAMDYYKVTTQPTPTASVIYAALSTTGTPTYLAAGSLILTVSILQD